jgi:hypothetical protein
MKITRLKTIAMVMLTAIVAMAPRIANGCATCGLSDTDHASKAYKTSVLFMLASPYASFFVIGGVAYIAWRRATRDDRK